MNILQDTIEVDQGASTSFMHGLLEVKLFL